LHCVARPEPGGSGPEGEIVFAEDDNSGHIWPHFLRMDYGASLAIRLRQRGSSFMCRNIRTLFNFDPPVTPDEVRAASLQFVRKITGFNKPSKANEAAFSRAIDEIAHVSMHLLQSLETDAPPKNREEAAAKAKARAAERFGASR
jgi:hypothetical protein